MEILAAIVGVLGWLAVGVLVNWFIDWMLSLANHEPMVLGDSVGDALAVVLWPIPLVIVTGMGFIAALSWAVSMRPGRRNESAK